MIEAEANHGELDFHIRTLRVLGLAEYNRSTRKFGLTERGNLAAELVWHTRFLIARGGPELAQEPARYAGRVGPRDQAVLFFDSPGIKREVSLPILLVGLLKGEAVAYFESEKRLDSEKAVVLRYE